MTSNISNNNENLINTIETEKGTFFKNKHSNNLDVTALEDIQKAHDFSKNYMSEFSNAHDFSNGYMSEFLRAQEKFKTTYDDLINRQSELSKLSSLKNLNGILSKNDTDRINTLLNGVRESNFSSNISGDKFINVKSPIVELQKNINSNNEKMFKTIGDQLQATIEANKIQSKILESMVATQIITEKNANDALMQSNENLKKNAFDRKVSIITLVVAVISTLFSVVALLKS